MTVPPLRLVDDPAALSSLRANLQRVREADGGYDAARGLARLQQELELTASSVDAPQLPASSPGSLAPTVFSGSKALWLSALAAAAVIGVGIWAVQASRAPAPRERIVQPPAPAAEPSPQVQPQVQHDDAPARTTAVEPAPAGDGARREIEQLAEIRALLARKPGAAYQLALRSSRAFPNGALREERDALTALALAQMGEREQARKHARAFVARYPKSPLRGAIERLLEERTP